VTITLTAAEPTAIPCPMPQCAKPFATVDIKANISKASGRRARGSSSLADAHDASRAQLDLLKLTSRENELNEKVAMTGQCGRNAAQRRPPPHSPRPQARPCSGAPAVRWVW
jgi:hypothetical protein